jgi:hypothetical protein
MRDRHANDLAGIVAARERRVGSFDPQMHILADEFQLGIAHQNAGQQPGFAQDLETVADAEHETAIRRMLAHRVHHRGARRDRAAAQIIAIGKPAGHDHEIGAFGQLRLSMPDHRRLVAGDELERPRHVALAVDSGKDENG